MSRLFFGTSVLMARRLVEAGVNLVQVNLGKNSTWDTHRRNFVNLKDFLEDCTAITTDPFIVLTSNVFAVLGLRALYFLLAGMAEKFHLLAYGLAMVLMFIGVKMLIVDFYKIPVGISLGVVAALVKRGVLREETQRIERIAYDDVMVIPMGTLPKGQAVRANVENFKPYYIPRMSNVWLRN